MSTLPPPIRVQRVGLHQRPESPPVDRAAHPLAPDAPLGEGEHALVEDDRVLGAVHVQDAGLAAAALAARDAVAVDELHTEGICSVDLDLGGQEWRLRVAAVTADPDLVEDVEDLDERWKELATPAALVFYDETLTARDKHVRLRELADRAGADTPDRKDAHGYIRSLHRREHLASLRIGEQGEEPDPDAVERMLPDQDQG